MTYNILMRNVLTLAEYRVPTQITGILCERLIVERIEQGGSFLTITEAGRCDPSEVEVPKDLPIGNTLVGTLIRSEASLGRETFIFNRAVPDSLAGGLRGAFFPGDGCVSIQWTGRAASLVASGRHLHALDDTGQVVHACEPFESDEGALTWLFDAFKIAWTGETIPNSEEA